MSTWYSKNLGAGPEAGAMMAQINTAFPPLFQALGQPQDMAVFTRDHPRSDETTVYFTPSAAPLARRFGAAPCAKPERDGLEHLAGPTEALQIHFPGKTHQ